MFLLSLIPLPFVLLASLLLPSLLLPPLSAMDSTADLSSVASRPAVSIGSSAEDSSIDSVSVGASTDSFVIAVDPPGAMFGADAVATESFVPDECCCSR